MVKIKATPELMKTIAESIEELDFGVITIKVNEERDYVELLVEDKHRFPVKRRGKVLECKTEIRNG